MPSSPIPVMDRFPSKYKMCDSGCWEWQAGVGVRGYGRFWYEGKARCAHIVSYILHKGEIPKGMLVCHHCDNPLCVNPAHLFLGTDQDNYDDAVAKGRIIKKQKVPMELKSHPSTNAYKSGCRCTFCKSMMKHEGWVRRRIKEIGIIRPSLIIKNKIAAECSLDPFNYKKYITDTVLRYMRLNKVQQLTEEHIDAVIKLINSLR